MHKYRSGLRHIHLSAQNTEKNCFTKLNEASSYRNTDSFYVFFLLYQLYREKIGNEGEIPRFRLSMALRKKKHKINDNCFVFEKHFTKFVLKAMCDFSERIK